ncbi:hypothetical protein D3C77_778780 [compost metagenome]
MLTKLHYLLHVVIRILLICMTLKMQKTKSTWVQSVSRWFYVKKSVVLLLIMKLVMQLLQRFCLVQILFIK